MDLIERYLANMRLLLPKVQRDDIIAELRDVLTVCRNEEAAKLGRPLTLDEDENLLREFGHPIVVAGRYRSQQQYLIGPDLYPVYTFVLKLVLAIILCAALLFAVVGSVAASMPAGPAITQAIRIAWTGSFAAVGSITVVFAVLQRYSAPLRLFHWRARDLPAIRERRVTPVVDHVAGIVASAFFILLWIHVVPMPSAIPVGPGQGLHLALAPVWQTLYWPVLGAVVCAIAVHAVRLTRTGRGRLGHGLDLALQLGFLIVSTIALRAGHWIVVSAIGMPAQALATVDHGANITLQIALVVVVCIAVIRAGYDLWQLFRADETVKAALS
jgi:hypothetical protein